MVVKRPSWLPRPGATAPGARLPIQPPSYDEIGSVETLTRAWRAVRRAGGGAGADGQTIAAFERRWAANMAELAAELRTRRYHPLPLKAFLLPKPDGGTRPISLLSLRDRIVQRAVLEVVQPAFLAVASPSAFGALPGRGVPQALARVEAARATGLAWIVHTDIARFFEEIAHERIRAAFRAVVADRDLNGLVAEWLAAGVIGPGIRSTPDNCIPTDVTADAGTTLAADAANGLDEWRVAEAPGLFGWVRRTAVEFPELDVLRPLAVGLAGRAGGQLLRGGLSLVPGAAGVALGLGVGAAGLTALALARRHLRRTAAVRAGDEVVDWQRLGTPQGAPLSPLLATSALAPLDVALNAGRRSLVRYVDDMVVLCPDEGEARRALADIEAAVTALGLRLNEAKTAVQPYDAGFTFLGAQLPPMRSAEEGGVDLPAAFGQTAYWQARLRLGLSALARRPPGRAALPTWQPERGERDDQIVPQHPGRNSTAARRARRGAQGRTGAGGGPARSARPRRRRGPGSATDDGAGDGAAPARRARDVRVPRRPLPGGDAGRGRGRRGAAGGAVQRPR
jgi:retron-type reverse transcriptase